MPSQLADNHRIYLRALEPEDYELIHQWRSDSGYQEGVVSMKRYTSKETERKWVERAIESHERGENLRFGIVLKETDELIGLVYLAGIDHVHKKAGFGSWIGEPENRGLGYVTEARLQALDYAFNELRLERIGAKVLESNTASKRSVEKFGYVREGTLRKYVYKNGRYNDVAIYSLLREEYLKRYMSIE
jgi:RimJ/RimL family protein N-acetyltransferase